MQTVCLKPLYHRGKENIALYYPNDSMLNHAIRRLKDVRWSQSNRCWYVPLTDTAYRLIEDSLKTIAVIDSALLISYLQKKRQVVKTLVLPFGASVVSKATSNTAVSPAWKLSKENLDALQKFIEQLTLKAYSSSTIKTYRNEFLQLLQLLKKKPVYELTTDDLRRYFIYCFEKLHLTENTLHSRINAIKFYFEQVLGKEKFFWEIYPVGLKK